MLWAVGLGRGGVGREGPDLSLTGILGSPLALFLPPSSDK